MDFFYSFIVTLMHSIWQAALLLYVYLLINLLEKNYHPLQKRNFLYLLLLAQLCISAITFFIFLNNCNFNTTSGVLVYFQGNQLPFLKNYYGLVFTFYIGIVTVKIVQLVIQWASFKTKYTVQLSRPSADLKIFTTYHSSLLCIKKNVTLWFSNSIKSPVTFGFLKPVILLPVSLINNISTQQAELIILHELIHIKSKDYLLNWFLLAMETIYFFNPFIKITADKLKLEREKNCDIQVLNYQYGKIKYAETLYEIAKNQTELGRFQLGVFKNNSQLYKRISFFSTQQNIAFKKLNFHLLSFIVVVFTAVIAFLMLAKNEVPFKSGSQTSLKFVREAYQKRIVYTSPIAVNEPVVCQKDKEREKTPYYHIEKKIKLPEGSMNNEEVLTENIYTPVSYKEIIDSTKEVIYNVETKNTTITQSYKMVKKKGTWVFEPQWMIVEKRPDSSKSILKDSVSISPNY